ncbi:hypothetical protein EYF80_025591 [Liparis tanakae]|uniref:Uncharacterized protein n=1 Tax=Liparis tanakae TaxID=230148 RepID=A0A4Z2HGY9_9TELE|nr:hypothetical protein EYF80_025591 [Liparis tanakae]
MMMCFQSPVQFDPRLCFIVKKHIRNINFFIYLKGYLGSQQTNKQSTSHLNLGNNINSNNVLEVLIAGVKLTPRVKHVSKCEGNRRDKLSKSPKLVNKNANILLLLLFVHGRWM